MTKKEDIITELLKYIPCNLCIECIGECTLYKSYKYNYTRTTKQQLVNILKSNKQTQILKYDKNRPTIYKI